MDIFASIFGAIFGTRKTETPPIGTSNLTAAEQDRAYENLVVKVQSKAMPISAAEWNAVDEDWN